MPEKPELEFDLDPSPEERATNRVRAVVGVSIAVALLAVAGWSLLTFDSDRAGEPRPAPSTSPVTTPSASPRPSLSPAPTIRRPPPSPTQLMTTAPPNPGLTSQVRPRTNGTVNPPRAEQQLVMPTLVGMTRARARDLLRTMGWQGLLSSHDEPTSDRSRDGVVLWQSVRAADELGLRQPLVLRVARFEGPTSAPTTPLPSPSPTTPTTPTPSFPGS